MAPVSEGIRQKLALLLAGENLESPQQLLAFDDGLNRTISSWEMFQQSNNVVRNRKAKYREFERMDEMSSDIHQSLNSYAEEAVVKNREKDRSVWASSDNETLMKEIHDLFDTLRVEDNIEGIARNVAKYGDEFDRLYYDESGLIHWQYLDPWRVDRVTDDMGRLRGYSVTGLQSLGAGGSSADADPWDIIHFRIAGVDRNGWGTSILDGLQRTWRILDQLETALALYRLHRAADRIIFYVDVGTASQDQAYEVVNRWKQIYRKRKWFDPKSNEVDFKHSPIDILEDIFWPVRKDSNSKVDKLQGSNNVGDIADIEMWRNKLRYGLGIPKGYWGDDDGGVFDAKAGLVQQDMKFSRGVARIQRALINGLTKLVQIHLALRGENPDPSRFAIRMEPVSYLEEMQRMEALQQRVIVLQGLVEVGMGLGLDMQAWSEYLLKTVMFTTDDEFREFLMDQAEKIAEKQQEQADMERKAAENELKGQEIENKGKQAQFNKEKGDAKQAAKKPGGQSGVTVNIHNDGGKAAATKKSKKSRMSDGIVATDTLTEAEIAAIEAYRTSKKEKIEEIREEINRLESQGVVVDLN